MKLTDGLFLDCARNISKKYKTIGFSDIIVDNACLQLVLNPLQFDILLLENLYGDIVSDLAAGWSEVSVSSPAPISATPMRSSSRCTAAHLTSKEKGSPIPPR